MGLEYQQQHPYCCNISINWRSAHYKCLSSMTPLAHWKAAMWQERSTWKKSNITKFLSTERKVLDQNSVHRTSGTVSHCNLLKSASHFLMTHCSQAGLSFANAFAFPRYWLLCEQTTFLPVSFKLLFSFIYCKLQNMKIKPTKETEQPFHCLVSQVHANHLQTLSHYQRDEE